MARSGEADNLDELITAATNAAFDCGAWEGDDAEEYRQLLSISTGARKALRDYIEKLKG